MGHKQEIDKRPLSAQRLHSVVCGVGVERIDTQNACKVGRHDGKSDKHGPYTSSPKRTQPHPIEAALPCCAPHLRVNV